MDFYEQAKELVAKMTLEEKLSQMKYNAPAIERLGIPAYNWWNECLHGLARNGVATVFPQVIAMAASFNSRLMKEVAGCISDEIRAKYNENKKQGYTDIYQGLTMCSPNINIFRDPRWGRGHETFGEDPTLTAVMATEYIKGLQGDGKYRKADATLKHFAVHSGPEGGRHGFDVTIDEETLFDTYLKAFEYCIRNGDPSAVMGAYNAVNGEPCVASKTLLKDILRDTFGFQGYVVSDAGAVGDIYHYHKRVKDLAEGAALSVTSGCDLCIGDAYAHLPEAYQKGWISEERIDEAVTRLFTARFRLGMFADDCVYDEIPYELVDCEKHRELNLKMAEESIVLLKNDGILPLSEDLKIAVIGPNADNKSILLANYNGTPSKYTTLLRGLQEQSDVLYAMGCDHEQVPGPWSEKTEQEALIIANKADVVILCMGLSPEMEDEGGEQRGTRPSGDKLTICLPEVQQKLYQKIKELNKPMVFVNVSGSCVALGDQKEHCNAVIQCFYPGARGGDALANVIFGKVSPSGRLPVTFYACDEDLPDMKDYRMENRTYRYFKGIPVFEFGYGLIYPEVEEDWIDEHTVEIRNKGSMDTAYAVLQFERSPHKQLKNFKKVFVKAQEKVTVVFE